MKSKKNLYILLSAVVFIWGIVSYKIYVYLKADKTNPIAYNSLRVPVSNEKILPDTFHLILDYPDPFLKKAGKVKRVEKVARQSAVSSKRAPVQADPVTQVKIPASTINWKVIKYSGMMKSNNSSEKIALISLNTKSLIIKEGDEVEGFTISRIYRDSLHVLYGDLSHTLIKDL